MNMSAKIGYDGQPPEFREKRGSEVRDPRTGTIIRQGEMGIENVNIDRLAWLLAHKRIEPHQCDAGRRLQQDWELSELRAFSTFEGGKTTGGAGNLLPDVKCDAIKRREQARKSVGNSGWRIIEMVVIENKSLEKCAAILRVKPSSMSTGLMVALDALAAHYGLST